MFNRKKCMNKYNVIQLLTTLMLLLLEVLLSTYFLQPVQK